MILKCIGVLEKIKSRTSERRIRWKIFVIKASQFRLHTRFLLLPYAIKRYIFNDLFTIIFDEISLCWKQTLVMMQHLKSAEGTWYFETSFSKRWYWYAVKIIVKDLLIIEISFPNMEEIKLSEDTNIKKWRRRNKLWYFDTRLKT